MARRKSRKQLPNLEISSHRNHPLIGQLPFSTQVPSPRPQNEDFSLSLARFLIFAIHAALVSEVFRGSVGCDERADTRTAFKRRRKEERIALFRFKFSGGNDRGVVRLTRVVGAGRMRVFWGLCIPVSVGCRENLSRVEGLVLSQ